MTNLYEIDAAIAAAIERMFDTVDAETGEIDAGTVEELEALQAERAAKLDNIGAYIKNLDAEVEAIDKEIATLKSRKDVKKAKIERLKDYVTESLKKSDKPKFESARVVFSFRKSMTVNVLDVEALPADYVNFSIEKKPDKMAIKKAIQAGEVISGAELVENQSLQIK